MVIALVFNVNPIFFLNMCSVYVTNNMEQIEPIEIEYYITQTGKSSFEEWFHSLKDIKTKAIVLKRLARVRLGNFGEWRSLGGGLGELKINFGPGYRIYFGQKNKILVILLCAGNKNTQEKDIKKAFEFWRDCHQRGEK